MRYTLVGDLEWQDGPCPSRRSRAGGETAHTMESMGIPAMLAVDDDPLVSAAMTRDLRGRFNMDDRMAQPGPACLVRLYRGTT